MLWQLHSENMEKKRYKVALHVHTRSPRPSFLETSLYISSLPFTPIFFENQLIDFESQNYKRE